MDCFYEIGAELSQFDDIKIETKFPTKMTKWRVKQDFAEKDRMEKAAIAQKNSEAHVHIKILRDLGFNVGELEYLVHHTPAEHLEVESEYIDATIGQYIVLCRKGTMVYDLLLRSGILEETYPKWL